MLQEIIKYIIAIVWLINGLFCKILNLVPRHQEIVSRILGDTYSREMTFTIGVLEILMVIWILSRFKSKINAITQILIVLVMNVIEFVHVPDLLLRGKFNIIFAILFSVIIYLNEFKLNLKKS